MLSTGGVNGEDGSASPATPSSFNLQQPLTPSSASVIGETNGENSDAYDVPLITALTKEIGDNHPKTALRLLAKIDDSLSSLGYPLVLATECGSGELVLALADKIGATGALPTAICVLQKKPDNVRNKWDGKYSREQTYNFLIEKLAARQSLQLDHESKQDLQDAIENMIRKKESDHIELLLKNPEIVADINLNYLLKIAINSEVKNAHAAKLVVDKGATNGIEILLQIQCYEGAARNHWVQRNGYEAFRQHLIAHLAARTEELAEHEKKEDLQSAVESMIRQGENDQLESLLKGEKVLSWLDLDFLLETAINLEVKNSRAARLLVEKGAKNIIPMLLQIQSYGRMTRSWPEANGCELVRKCLIDKLSRMSDFESSIDSSLERVILNIVESREQTAPEELRVLVVKNTEFAKRLNFSVLLMKSLESWNGKAAQIFAIAGAENVVDALEWMQKHYSSLQNVVQEYIQIWATSNWQDTYRCFANVLAGNWLSVFEGNETESPTCQMVIAKNIEFRDKEEEKLLPVLKQMIELLQEEALIALNSGENSVIRKMKLESLIELFWHSVKVGNGSAVESILELIGLRKTNYLYEALELLITKYRDVTWKKGNYIRLRDLITTLLLDEKRLVESIGEEEDLLKLFKLLETAIFREEEPLLRRFSENTKLAAMDSFTEKMNFFRFKKALLDGNEENSKKCLTPRTKGLCAYLEYLMENRTTLQWTRGNYEGVILHFMSVLLEQEAVYEELKEREKVLQVLSAAIKTKETTVFSRMMSNNALRNRLTLADRLSLFSRVIKNGDFDLGKLLFNTENDNFSSFLLHLIPAYKNEEWRKSYVGLRDEIVLCFIKSQELTEVNISFVPLLSAIVGGQDNELLTTILAIRTIRERLTAVDQWKLVKIALASENLEAAKTIISLLPAEVSQGGEVDKEKTDVEIEFSSDDNFFQFLRKLTALGNEKKVFYYVLESNLKQKITPQHRVELFEIAVLFEHYDMAKQLMEDQPISPILTALVGMRVDFSVGAVSSEKLTGGKLRRRELYLELARETLSQVALFADFPISDVEDALSSDEEDEPQAPKVPMEKRLLTQVLESFIAGHEPDASSFLEMSHIAEIIKSSQLFPHFLRYSVMVLNVPVIQVLICDDPLNSQPIQEEMEDDVSISDVPNRLNICWDSNSITLGDVVYSIRYIWERLSGFDSSPYFLKEKTEQDRTEKANANLIFQVLIKKLAYLSEKDRNFNQYFNAADTDEAFEFKKSSRELMLVILERAIAADDLMNFNNLIKTMTFLKPEEANGFLEVILKSKHYSLLPAMVERAPHRLMEVIQHIQALPISERDSTQKGYFLLLKKLTFFIQSIFSQRSSALPVPAVSYPSDLAVVDSSVSVHDPLKRLIAILSCCIEQDDEEKLLKLFSKPYVVSALGELSGALLEKMIIQRKRKLVVLAIKHLPDNDSQGSQFKQQILSPLFLEASRKDEDDFVAFCLDHITNRDDLGLFEGELNSPIAAAVMEGAFKVTKRLLDLLPKESEEGKRQDYRFALTKVEERYPRSTTTETMGTLFNWNPVFPEELRDLLRTRAETYYPAADLEPAFSRWE